ncbi:MAG: type V CRISPR-associated protein Cas12a/Cpf1 [Spirochaetales bacterium]
MLYDKTFTNCYPITKTLRFELKPIDQTLAHIEAKGFIAQDEERAKDYKVMKSLIDECHKDRIEKALQTLLLDESLLEKYKEIYCSQDKREKDFEAICSKLRESIAKRLSEYVGNLFTKDTFKDENLPTFLKSDTFLQSDYAKNSGFSDTDYIEIVKKFKNFYTYFGGYNDNRKNMYSKEEKSTAISFRIIHQNLPKFLNNITAFEKMMNCEAQNSIALLEKQYATELNNTAVKDFFTVSHFTKTLSQKQITLYNLLLGGNSVEGDKKKKGLNEYVNEFNQKQSDKKNKLPKFQILFKQILSDRETYSFVDTAFESDKEVLQTIQEFYAKLQDKVFVNGNGLESLLNNIESYNLDKIYIENNTSLTELSKNLYGSWESIETAVQEDLRQKYKKSPKQTAEKYEKSIEEKYKKIKYFSVNEINEYMSSENSEAKKCQEYFLSAANPENGIIITLHKAYEEFNNDNLCKKIFSDTDTETTQKKLAQSNESVEKIKLFLDSVKNLQYRIKALLAVNAQDKDAGFYNDIDEYYAIIDTVTALYNKVRNYATKKSYSQEKIKLNFENKGRFLGGWVDSRTEKSDNGTQAGGYLFRKKNEINEYDYFLGISSEAKKFIKNLKANGVYERLDYYQPKSNTIYGNSYVGENTYSEDKQILIKTIENFVSGIDNTITKSSIEASFENIKPEYKTPSKLLDILQTNYEHVYSDLLSDKDFKCENERLTDCLYKTIQTLTRIPKAKDYENSKFTLFTEAQKAIEELCKERVYDYFTVDDTEMHEMLNRDKKALYLFKITNKDLSYAESFAKGLRKSRGTENLHTLYFKTLMGGNQTVFDIGDGKIFYRKASLPNTDITHPKNIAIQNKNPDNKKSSSVFEYDLIKDRRYTVDKFQFHLSVTQNHQALGRVNINTLINEKIKNEQDIHIIGVDRGERHLLYITMINAKGEIVLQESLNIIKNEYNNISHKTDYRTLLNAKEENRDKERKSWQKIENIKELKAGYLSQVVHKLTQLIIEHNAIVVLEDLNSGFVQSRFKIEKQVYKKFEKMLIDKLNFYADKKKNPASLGGLLNAYQLTKTYADFNKYKESQCGCLFYIPAWNTSKIDPVTGFVNFFYTKYENVEKTKLFFEKFSAITFNKEKNYFEFHVDDYSRFNPKAAETKLNWVICTNGERVRTKKIHNSKRFESTEIILTNEFSELFKNHAIDIFGDIKEQISHINDKGFFVHLLDLFKITVQLRNSIANSQTDYLLSPVADSKGVFYDSRNVDASLPQNADANGAYNIARKGLLVVRQIQSQQEIKKVNCHISNREWLQFAQNSFE